MRIGTAPPGDVARADRKLPAAEALVSQLHREQFSASKKSVNIRVIDWIWHIRGRLALAPGQTGNDAFDRLDPCSGRRH